MPSWKIHFAIANQLVEKIRIEENTFIFANIMPDILAGHHSKKLSHLEEYKVTHHTMLTNINGIAISIPNIREFRQQYHKEFQNPVILGYFSHLLADYYWNQYAYEHCFKQWNKEKTEIEVRLKDGTKQIMQYDDAVKIKQKDFHQFSQEIQKTIQIYPTYQTQIYEDSKVLGKIYFTPSDLKNTAEYIQQEIKNKKEVIQEEYQMLHKEELERLLEESIDFILANIP